MSETQIRHPYESMAIQDETEDETDSGGGNDLKIPVFQDSKGLTLHKAVCGGNEELVKFLVEKMPQPTLTLAVESSDDYGTTLLHVAARNGHRDVAKVLIDSGAPVDTMDKSGTTALHVAAKNGYERVIEVLVNAGATVDTEDMYGWTPLSSALLKDYSNVVRYLINIGNADRSKVKYQFQNRLATLLIEEDSAEVAGGNTQQVQSKSITNEDSKQSLNCAMVCTVNINGDSDQEFEEHSYLQTTDRQTEDDSERSCIDQRQTPPKEVLDTKHLSKEPKAKQFPKPVRSHDERHSSTVRKESLNSEQVSAIGPNIVMIIDSENQSAFPRRPGVYERPFERTSEDSNEVRQLRQPSVELGDDPPPRVPITNDENKPPLNYKKKKVKKRWLKFWNSGR